MTIYYCFCVKCIMLCLYIWSFPSSSFSASLIWNVGIFRAKKYCIDHQTANAIQLFVPIKRKFFGSLLFLNKLQWRGIRQGLHDKYSHLFICMSLKWTFSSGQKPVYTVKILVSEQIVFTAVLWFGQVFLFYRLINESKLECILLEMCKWKSDQICKPF